MSLQGGGGYQSPWSSQTGLTEIDGSIGELEPLGELTEVGFEPQTRARSNTWPLPRPDNYVEPGDDGGSKKNSTTNLSGAPPLPSSVKKNTSRRNAWGNLSYADLITQAITSSQDNRLTLSQIYEWMVQNVPYFKDKGDSNSSAGWKNSIRHNLSLHNRFMRVQNEGTGKSSWWMINPDAKPGKSVRRRAASMETSKFEKRRGRVKKKAEAFKNGVGADATPSPSSSISEGIDMFPDSPLHSGFQLSPSDFRQRASSNASSCSRFSPIPSLMPEPEWEPYAPAGDFTPLDEYAAGAGEYAPADQLAGNLQDSMKLQNADPFLNTYVPTTSSSGAVFRYDEYNACRLPYPSHSAPPPPPCYQRVSRHDPNDIMQTEQTTLVSTTDQGLMNGGLMLQTMGPTTVMGQIINSGLIEDLNLNIESLDHGFDCNVDEVIKHELSMEGSLDFNFPQQQQQPQGHTEGGHFAAPAPPAPASPLSGGGTKPPYSVAPSWVH